MQSTPADNPAPSTRQACEATRDRSTPGERPDDHNCVSNSSEASLSPAEPGPGADLQNWPFFEGLITILHSQKEQRDGKKDKSIKTKKKKKKAQISE